MLCPTVCPNGQHCYVKLYLKICPNDYQSVKNTKHDTHTKHDTPVMTGKAISQITPSTPVPLATAHRFPQHLFDLLNLLDLLDLWDLLDILLILDTYILLDRDNVEGGMSF